MGTKSVRMSRVVMPDISTEEAISGQIVVTAAGTAVQGPDVSLINGVYIMSHPENIGLVGFGNDGSNDVDMNNSIVLEKGKFGPPVQVSNLNEIWFDAANDGDKFCWLKA